MLYGYIYKITNTVNNKIYIGQTKRNPKDRWDEYKRSPHNEHLKNSFNKYGIESFIFEIIDTAESHEELNTKEKYYISKYDSTNVDKGYNLSAGGNGPLGVKWSEEACLVASKDRLGSRWFHKGTERHLIRACNIEQFVKEHPDFIQGYGEGRTHRPPSEETRKKMSEHCVFRNKSKESYEKQIATYKSKKFHWYTNGRDNRQIPEGQDVPEGFYRGKFLSEEAKKSMGKQNIGRTPWNKGLTKYTDDRVASYGKLVSAAKSK